MIGFRGMVCEEAVEQERAHENKYKAHITQIKIKTKAQSRPRLKEKRI